jgi:hypothetical protein
VGMGRGPVGVGQGPVGVERGPVGVGQGPVGVEREPGGVAAFEGHRPVAEGLGLEEAPAVVAKRGLDSVGVPVVEPVAEGVEAAWMGSVWAGQVELVQTVPMHPPEPMKGVLAGKAGLTARWADSAGSAATAGRPGEREQ